MQSATPGEITASNHIRAFQPPGSDIHLGLRVYHQGLSYRPGGGHGVNGFETTVAVDGLSDGGLVIVEVVGGVGDGMRSDSVAVGQNRWMHLLRLT